MKRKFWNLLFKFGGLLSTAGGYISTKSARRMF